MKRSNFIILGGLCACFAVVFQIIPALFSELFIFVTVLSTIPIYIISRLNPKLGITALITAGIIILFISVHQGLFFFFTNGPIGLALGVGRHYFDSRRIISGLSGFCLAFTLSTMNFVIGIPVFGSTIPGNTIVQILIILMFSVVYSFMYLNLLDYVFEILNGLFKLE